MVTPLPEAWAEERVAEVVRRARVAMVLMKECIVAVDIRERTRKIG